MKYLSESYIRATAHKGFDICTLKEEEREPSDVEYYVIDDEYFEGRVYDFPFAAMDAIDQYLLKGGKDILKCECCGNDINCKEISELNNKILCEECLAEFSKDYISKIYSALEIAAAYGGVGGEHHKTWVIDQMVRILAGERYREFVKDTCSGEDGPDTYSWEIGIAP